MIENKQIVTRHCEEVQRSEGDVVISMLLRLHLKTPKVD